MKISEEHVDALRELINVGVGRAAGSLNSMVGAHVRLRVPVVDVVSAGRLRGLLHADPEEALATVRLGFSGALRGSADLIFSTDSASKLVRLLVGEDDEDPTLDSVRAGALTEVGNILLNSVMGSIGNVVEQGIEYDLPTYRESDMEQLIAEGDNSAEGKLVLAQTHFLIGKSRFELEEECIEGEITIIFGVNSFEALLAHIDHIVEAALP